MGIHPFGLLLREWAHFRSLRPQTRALLVSFTTFAASYPLLVLFSNAFLWDREPSPTLLGAYNTALFAAIPLGFYVCGLLMRRYPANYLYAVGFFGQAAPVGALVIVNSSGYLSAICFGTLLGFVSGIYWGARHLLSLELTTDDERDYFFAIDGSIQRVCAVVMPILIGVLIEFRFFVPGVLDSRGAYLVLLGFAVVLMLLASLQIVSCDFKVVTPTSLGVTKRSEGWSHARRFTFFKGLANGGATCIPVLLALSMLGNESELGATQSFAALVTAILTYAIGRMAYGAKHRVRVLTAGTVALILGGLALAVSYSVAGVLVFSVLYVLGWALTWNSTNALTYSVLEREEKCPELRYGYICDRELWLTLGRTAGMALFFGIILTGSPDAALRITPLCLALAQLVVLDAGIRLSR